VKFPILDDYFDTFRALDCFRKLDGHDVTIHTDPLQSIGERANRLKDTEVGIASVSQTLV
jgi:D-3-phosphoglycerate dehydrogenase